MEVQKRIDDAVDIKKALKQVKKELKEQRKKKYLRDNANMKVNYVYSNVR